MKKGPRLTSGWGPRMVNSALAIAIAILAVRPFVTHNPLHKIHIKIIEDICFARYDRIMAVVVIT